MDEHTKAYLDSMPEYEDLLERLDRIGREGTSLVEGPIIVFADKEGRLRIERLDTADVQVARKNRLCEVLNRVTAANTSAALVNAWAQHHTGPTGQRELERLLTNLRDAYDLLAKEYDRG